MPKMSKVPKMPKIYESLRSVVFKIKARQDSLLLGILVHFRHFRHFKMGANIGIDSILPIKQYKEAMRNIR
jgi:hypothetical protein